MICTLVSKLLIRLLLKLLLKLLVKLYLITSFSYRFHASFLLSKLILNLPLIPYIARILAVPRTFLISIILFFSVTGIYLMSFNNFDIFLMIGIAVLATILRLYDFPMPPLILAFVLGGLMEENLRRSLLISDGSWSFLWDRPLTLIIMSTILSIIAWQGYKTFIKKT